MRMNTGKTQFAQLMDFLPWTTFTRIVDRYGGDHRVRIFLRRATGHGLRPADLPGKPARHRDLPLGPRIETLSHGLPTTLADANERRDWRIHAALAQRLITQARTLYVDEELGLDLTNTVYALGSRFSCPCLVFLCSTRMEVMAASRKWLFKKNGFGPGPLAGAGQNLRSADSRKQPPRSGRRRNPTQSPRETVVGRRDFPALVWCSYVLQGWR